MPAKTTKKTLPVPTFDNPNIATLFADNLSVTTRSDTLHLVRFMALLPERKEEQVRLMIPDPSLKAMLDALCQHCNYYPAKPQATRKKRKVKKTAEK